MVSEVFYLVFSSNASPNFCFSNFRVHNAAPFRRNYSVWDNYGSGDFGYGRVFILPKKIAFNLLSFSPVFLCLKEEML
jgi:hypothetical protein